MRLEQRHFGPGRGELDPAPQIIVDATAQPLPHDVHEAERPAQIRLLLRLRFGGRLGPRIRPRRPLPERGQRTRRDHPRLVVSQPQQASIDVERVLERDLIPHDLDQLERVRDVRAQQTLLRDRDRELDAPTHRFRKVVGTEEAFHGALRLCLART